MQRFRSRLAVYAVVALAFLVVDAAWLLFVAADMFKHHVGDILRPAPDYIAALAFYMIYPAGLVALAVWPALTQGGLRDAIAKGAVLGFTAYATFDLTNLAIIKGWSWRLAAADMAWGAAASAVAAACGYAIGARSRTRDVGADRTRPE